MQYRLVQYKEDLYARFWVIPLLVSLLAVLLAGITLWLDHTAFLPALNKTLSTFVFTENARTTLSIIATAVVTITSVTFSITVLILSINAQQLGPRILPNFMRQKPTQLVLGLFIGTFIYTMLVLHALPLLDAQSQQALISITVSLLLGIISFFTLIYFIHFVCHIIQIDNILIMLSEELLYSVKRTLNTKLPCNQGGIHKAVNKDIPLEINHSYKHTTIITACESGYIQTIDYDVVLNLAKKQDMMIKILFRTGEFIFHELPMIEVLHNAPLKKKDENICQNAIQIGIRRSTVQDIEFAFEELSEIALRALSPGINNPYTAILCVNRIVEGFSVLAKEKTQPSILVDNEGAVKIFRKITNYPNIVNAALNRLRQQTQQDLSVSIQLLRTLTRLFELPLPDDLKKALFAQAEMIHNSAIKNDINENDKQDIQEKFNALKRFN